MSRLVTSPAAYVPAVEDIDIMEIERSEQESSAKFEQLGSICNTARRSLKPELSIQDPAPGFKSSMHEMPAGIVAYDLPETEGRSSELYLPPLSAAEQWDLEGFFQIVYTLSAFAFPPDTTPWETYSPLIVKAFFKAAEDEDQLFTDNVLTVAFQNCADVFATYYEWPEHTKAEVFAYHSTGKAALAAVLQLIKLAKGFGIDGEEWWELRRSLWIAFAQPFQRNGWVSETSDIFHKLFTQSLQVFLDLGVKPGTWTFTIVGGLNAWRKVKEIQEAVAAERIIVTLRKRVKVESASDTLRMSVNGDTENTPQCSPVMQSQNSPQFGPNFENNSASMSPGSRLREHERIKPLLNLQQRLAPSPPAPPPKHSPIGPLPISTPTSNRVCSYSGSYGALGVDFPVEKTHPPAVTSLDFLSTGTFSQEYFFSLDNITDPGFGDLDLDFEDFADVEPMDWNDSGMFSNTDSFVDEGFESQPMETPKRYRESHEEIVEEALQWSGKQLWEMTGEEFSQFCSQSPPWQ